MLEAHRTLASLNEKDREQFKDVVSMLEAETPALGSPALESSPVDVFPWT